MRSHRTPATLATAIAVAMTLLVAGPAAADAVRRQQLAAPTSSELTSGLSTFLVESNLKRTGDLTPESRRAYDSSWNRYSYVLNNPLKYVDPDGEWAHIAIGAVIGSAIGAGSKMISNSSQGKPLMEGVGKAALVGVVGGGVAAATFGVGATLITGGGMAGAASTFTLAGSAAIPTAAAGGGLSTMGGAIVGAGSGALGGATSGALNEGWVEGNSDSKAIGKAALKGAGQGLVSGGALGAMGAGPAVEAVASEFSVVVEHGTEVYEEWKKSIDFDSSETGTAE